MTGCVLAAGAQRVYDALVRAAETDAYCPTNPEISAMIGGQSVSTGANAIALLEKRGLIEVRRFSCGREVTIKATGKSTARHTGSRAPHWRLAGAGVDPSPKRPSAYIRIADRDYAPLVEERFPPRIDRHPCFRCGTRADVGCAHNPLPASVTPDARHLGAGPKNPAPLSTPVSSHTAQHGEV